MILASTSSFFMKVLGKNKHSNPLVYMKGMKFDELNALVDYIYKGEVSIHAKDLDKFLLVTKELGLEVIENVPESSALKDPRNQNNEHSLGIKMEPMDPEVTRQIQAGSQVLPENRKSPKMRKVSRKEKVAEKSDNGCNFPDNSIEQARYLYSIKTRELDNDIKEMVELSPNFVIQSNPGNKHKREKNRICKVC